MLKYITKDCILTADRVGIFEKIRKNNLNADELDLKLIEFLNNYYDEDSPNSFPPHLGNKSRKAVKITALITAVVFSLLFLNSWFRAIIWPLPQQEQHALKEFHINSTELEKIKKTVVSVESWSISGISNAVKTGTGFNIDPYGHILTNKHIVQNSSHIRVRFPEERNFNNLSCKISKDADLALIKINPKVLSHKLPYLKFAEKNPSIGESIFIIGNPHRLDRVIETGRVIGYFTLPNSEQTVMAVSASAEPGSSGSPVFNSSGRIVGIIYASLMGNAAKGKETISLAVPLSQINEFLEKSK